MRDHVTRRPMPVEQSIHWKPLRDPHYVVASLQPSDGGRRKIFIRQPVIGRVEALVRAYGRRTVGLLLGQPYQCSTTGASYLVVESISELDVIGDENELANKVAEALADRGPERHARFFESAEQRAHVLGWYRGTHSIEAKPSLTTAGIHVSLFGEPWQMTLAVSEGALDGAFFLRDSVNSRWFCSPFYELLSDAPAEHQPKPTLVGWPQYITAEAVVPAEPPVIAPAARPELVNLGTTKLEERPWLRRLTANHDRAQRTHHHTEDVPLGESPSSDPSASSALLDETLVFRTGLTPGDEPPADQLLADRPLADRATPLSVEPGLADAPRGNQDRGGWRRGWRSTEKASIVDDSDQVGSPSSAARRVSDDDDTVLGDNADHFIDIARAEGFFIAAKFDAVGAADGSETMWVLNEPYSGMLLAVVAANSQVVDATLHYNLETDDAGLKTVAFPEHRDAESKTIYMRETCMDSLRARCRRLRATNGLLREWKVTPTISFLTPGEWESLPPSGAPADRGAHAITDLNKARIADLPAGVRSQFHLSAGDASA